MYSGNIIDELIEMVARAESRAAREIVLAPQPVPQLDVYSPHLLFESSQQPVLTGVA